MATRHENQEGQRESKGRSGPIQLSGCPAGEEITPECDIIPIDSEADLEKHFADCEKNKGHDNFIPVNKFTIDKLPVEFQTAQTMEDIYKTCILTLRVTVPYTSPFRPDTFADNDAPYPYSKHKGDDKHVRYGTGSIVEVLYYQPIRGKPCPCPKCKKSKQPKMVFWWIHARTATHVIFDKYEAQRASFDCFYDINGPMKKQGVKTIYGIDAFMVLIGAGNKHPNDVFDVLCVTHDHETIAVLNEIMPPDYFLNPPTRSKTSAPYIVSHPHGCNKTITVGKIFDQTVPAGSKFPVNTPNEFEKGTKYRKTSAPAKDQLPTKKCTIQTTKEDGVVTIGDRVTQSDKSIVDKLNDLRKALTSNASDIYDTNERNGMSSTTSPVVTRDSNERYLVDFYFIYMTEKCLKILLMAAIKYQKSKGVEMDHSRQVTEAYEEVFRVYLEREYNPTSDPTLKPVSDSTVNPTSDQNPGTGSSESIPQIKHWINLLNESMEQFSAFKSSKEGREAGDISVKNPSLIVAWFNEIEHIMESKLTETKQETSNKEIQVELDDLLPGAGEGILRSGLDLITQFEKRRTSQNEINNCKEFETDTDIHKEREETGRLADSIVYESSGGKKVADCGVAVDGGAVKAGDEANDKSAGDATRFNSTNTGDGHRGSGDIGLEGNKDKEKERSEQCVPDGSTFTLPVNAEYAFRVYSHSPEWISFPPETIMTTPDGEHKDIGTGALEFQFPTVLPEFSYVTYSINTCPGSSGANVFCNILSKSIGTYFPHSGHVKQKGVNKSGIRDNLFALYNRSFMFSQTGDNKTKNKPDIVNFSKTLLEGQLHMLKKL